MDDNFSLKDALRIHILTQEGKKWPTYDGGNLTRWEFVSASEASSCVRQLSFRKMMERDAVFIPDFWGSISDEDFQARLDSMGDDDKLGIFERGNWMEEWVVKSLLASATPDEEYALLGDGQRSLYTFDKRVSGTPDGLYINHASQTYRVLEFKSSQNQTVMARQAHITQLLVNMGLLDYLVQQGKADEAIDLPLSSYTMLPGKLLYVLTDNYLTMAEFDVEYDGGAEFTLAATKAKALFTAKGDDVDLRSPDTLMPEGLENNGCFFCEFKGACRAIEEKRNDAAHVKKLKEVADRAAGRSLPKMPEFRALSKIEAMSALANYQKFKADEKTAKKNADALKPAIKEWCREEQIIGKHEWAADGDKFTVNYSESTRIGSIDKEKLNAFLNGHGKSDEDFRKPPTETDRLTVKVVPEDAYLHRVLEEVFTGGDDADIEVDE